MGQYIYAGTRLTYIATWNETGVLLWSSGVSDILAQVAAQLMNNYQLHVERSQVVAPAVAVGTITQTVTLNLYSGQDRNDVNDILGNCDDAFAVASGTRPSSSDITSITPPGGAPGKTGAPDPAPLPQNAGASWWDTFKTSVEAGSAGFIIGGVAVVALIIFIAIREP